jgi:hypothetical protein
MANITIGRYPVPTDAERAALGEAHPGAQWPSDRWESYVEPEDRSWILYVGVDGSPAFWPRREPSGAVIGEPTTR